MKKMLSLSMLLVVVHGYVEASLSRNKENKINNGVPLILPEPRSPRSTLSPNSFTFKKRIERLIAVEHEAKVAADKARKKADQELLSQVTGGQQRAILHTRNHSRSFSSNLNEQITQDIDPEIQQNIQIAREKAAQKKAEQLKNFTAVCVSNMPTIGFVRKPSQQGTLSAGRVLSEEDDSDDDKYYIGGYRRW